MQSEDVISKEKQAIPEVVQSVTMLKRNTYETVIKESSSHDYVNHHTKRHSQSPTAIRCDVKSIIQQEDLTHYLKKRETNPISPRLSPLPNHHLMKPTPELFSISPSSHNLNASFESSIMTDPRRDSNNFRLKLMKNSYVAGH